MEITKIGVERRQARGRNQLARLREQGRVPAVLYGESKDVLSLSVDEREFDRHTRQHHKVFLLSMDGKDQSVFLKDVQWDCLTDRPLHIDFYRIDLNKPMHLMVQLSYLGHPVGLSKGGNLFKDDAALPIVCMPAAIPESISVPISHLDVGDSLLASQLELPEGVTLDVPPDHVICHIVLDTGPDLPEEEEGAEGEVLAAGSEDTPGGS